MVWLLVEGPLAAEGSHCNHWDCRLWKVVCLELHICEVFDCCYCTNKQGGDEVQTLLLTARMQCPLWYLDLWANRGIR